MDNAAKKELHALWLKKENRRALHSHYAPLPQMRRLNIETPEAEVAAVASANAGVLNRCHADTLTAACIDAGPAFIPSLFGAGYTRDENSSWSSPVSDSAESLRIPSRFEPGKLPLWGEYERRLNILLENSREGGYLPGMADYTGPLDVLSALLGVENCCMALFLEPEAVHDRLSEIAALLSDIVAYETRLMRSAGMDGVTDCFALWMPESGVRMSDDFSALIGEEHFEEFGIPADRIVFAGLANPILHLHSSSIRHIPALLKLERLRAIELGNDPNGPGFAERLAAGRAILDSGRALQFSSWEIPLSGAERETAEQTLGDRGVLYRFQAASCDEADAWHDAGALG